MLNQTRRKGKIHLQVVYKNCEDRNSNISFEVKTLWNQNEPHGFWHALKAIN